MRIEAASLRILQVHSTDLGGGAETVARLHHEELLRQGHDSHFFVGRKKGDGANVSQIPHRRGIPGLLRLARFAEAKLGLQNIYSPSFRQFTRNLPSEFDVIHIHTLHGAGGYADLASLRNVCKQNNVFLTLHDLWLMTGHCGHPLSCERWKIGCGNCPDLTLYPAVTRDSTKWNFYVRKQTLSQCKAHLIVPSNWLAEQVKQSPILNHFPISVIPNPVDLTVFNVAKQRSLNSENMRSILLIAQHLNNPFKGIEDAILAINSLDRKENLLVYLAGKDCAAVRERLNVRTELLEYTNDPNRLAEYYRRADYVLVPSRGETFGLVAAEAMACGTPVISTKVGGLADVVGDLFPILCGRPRDPNSLSKSIANALTSSPEEWVSWSQAASARIRTLFSLERHTSECLSLYQSSSRLSEKISR